MNKGLISIEKRIDELMKQPNTMHKYEMLGILLSCKKYIETWSSDYGNKKQNTKIKNGNKREK